jgi:Ca2+-binding EF-hand superfamily protein
MVARLWSIWTPVALAGVLLMSVAGPAAAQSADKMQVEQAVRQIFVGFDGNGDGNITDKEFMDAGKRDFAALDTDRDAVVSEKEFLDPKPRGAEQLKGTELARAKQIWTQQFAGLDSDKNKKLSTAEHQTAEKRSFEHLDSNKDGEITVAELTAALSQR